MEKNYEKEVNSRYGNIPRGKILTEEKKKEIINALEKIDKLKKAGVKIDGPSFMEGVMIE